MDQTLAIVIAGAAVAGFAQGVSGFAFALVALSIWAWAVEPQIAAPMAVFGALVGQLVTLPWVWRGFELRKLAPLVIGGLLGVPLGVVALPYVGADAFKFVLGLFLLVYCPFMLFIGVDRHILGGGAWADGAAGLAGGVLGGMAGVSGPVPTLWTTLRGWEKDVQRGVLQAFNIAMHSATMTLYFLSGTLDATVLTMFAWITPTLILPAIAGVLLFRRIDQKGFRRLILVLLILSGGVLVAGSAGEVLGV